MKAKASVSGMVLTVIAGLAAIAGALGFLGWFREQQLLHFPPEFHLIEGECGDGG